MRNNILLSSLFLYTLAGGFLCFIANHVYGLWTNNFSLWLIVLPALLLGWLVGWALRRWAEHRVGTRTFSVLALLVALLAAFTFLDHAGLAADWTCLGLSYDAWKTFVRLQAALWFVPLAFLLPLLWVRGNEVAPRGRMTVFVGVCAGFILGRIFVGAAPFTWVWTGCVAAMLLAAGAWLVTAFENRRVRQTLAGVVVLLLLGAFLFGRSARLPEGETLEALNPYTIIHTPLGAGPAEGVDEAPFIASQLIPTLLKPAADARIAFRAGDLKPALPAYDTAQLKGLYDAIWVRLPPAAEVTERDYFGAAALNAVLTHLKDNGLMVYDLDARALDSRLLMERILILRKHFAHVQLWMTGLNEWQLVASRQPITADLNALTALADRPAVADCLIKAQIPDPIYLLPCCVVADTQKLVSALAEGEDAVKADLPWGEPEKARELLFDKQTALRLMKAFAPFYDDEMAWVAVPKEAEKDFRDLLYALRQTRKGVMTDNLINAKTQLEAGKANPYDPFLQSLADRYIQSAADLAKLANTQRALQFYDIAFATAVPEVEDILAAAELAKSTGDLRRVESYYALAISGPTPNFKALTEYAKFLEGDKQYEKAEYCANQAFRLILDGDPALQRSLRFFIATCVAKQPKRSAEGLAMARRIAASVTDQAEKDIYIPAYGSLLIDCGHAKEGLAIRRHYKAYGELLTQTEGNTP